MYQPRALEAIPGEVYVDRYLIGAHCKNCGLTESLYFKKGDEIGVHSCPVCEVISLELAPHTDL